MASNWRQNMRPASFRGVLFNIDRAEFEGGRRTVRHSYVGRDKIFTEDMGRLERDFPVEAFLVGDDYLDQLDDLAEALETSGPGELVHPYFGTKNVSCGKFTVRVSKDEGGYATIQIPFTETETEPAFPTSTVNAPAKMDATADAGFAALSLDLTSVYKIAGLSVGAVSNLASVIRSAGAQLRGLLGPIASTVQSLAVLQSALGDLVSSAEALARSPADFLDQVSGMFLALAPTDPAAGVQALLAAYNFAPNAPRPPATTPTQLQAQINFDALQRTIQRMALIQAARTAVAGSASVAARAGDVAAFPSYEDAIAARGQITDAIDAQLELASDTVFPALMQLRADLVLGLPGDDSELAHLIAFVPPATLPSLVLSHMLYGNLDGEADLIARNAIKHPGFIPGGRVLEVLSRV